MNTQNREIKHSNRYCIALLAITVLSFIVGILLMYFGDQNSIDFSFYATILLITIVLVLDRDHLKNTYPEKKIFPAITVILVPWYLYQRAKFVGEKQTYLKIWIVIMLLGAVSDYFIDKAFSGLPSCGDSRVVNAMSEIVENMGLSFESLSNTQEVSFDEASQMRVCQGTVTTQYMGAEEGQYKIYWADVQQTSYIVEVIPVYEY